MKKFLAILVLTFASFAHGDTINLLAGGYSQYADVFTFPVNGPYNYYYGTGVGIVEGGTYSYTNGNGFTEWEGFTGTTVGHMTRFANSVIYSSVFGNLSGYNATWNAKTDFFSMYFLSGGKKWHLTATYGAPNGSYDAGPYSYTYGSLTKAQITTVPEPGTLCLLGTGLLSIVLARKVSRGRGRRQTA